MSKVGKYVVFWDSPTSSNVHHYFDTLVEAQMYQNQTACSIAYVVSTARFKLETDVTFLPGDLKKKVEDFKDRTNQT